LVQRFGQQHIAHSHVIDCLLLGKWLYADPSQQPLEKLKLNPLSLRKLEKLKECAIIVIQKMGLFKVFTAKNYSTLLELYFFYLFWMSNSWNPPKS
jgi:hypothetical protein